MKHLLSIEDLDRGEIEDFLDLAGEFSGVLDREVPKVPALRGKTVALMFYEDSTRTRLSFDRAAKALSADVMTFTPGGSSVAKGESLKDTTFTIRAMSPSLFVVRHRSPGAPWRVAEWSGLPVVNGGDGAHQHPTQALLDVLTVRDHFGKVDGLKVAIVGDIRNSRVARSTTQALQKLGAEVTYVGPRTLLPFDMGDWGVETSSNLDEVLGEVDIVYMLRIQRERGGGDDFPSVMEYINRFSLTEERAKRLLPHAMVMHPGPMNRGIEIDASVADSERSLVTKQVANGIPIRMAVLFRLLTGETK